MSRDDLHLRELPTAVNSVASGEVYLTELVASLALPPAPPQAPLTDEEAICPLQAVLGWTRKEAEVGLLVQKGLVAKEIAVNPGLSRFAVNGRLRQLYRRQGIKGVRDVVRLASLTFLRDV